MAPADRTGFLSSRRFVLGLAFMRGSSRPSRAIEPGFGVGRCRALRRFVRRHGRHRGSSSPARRRRFDTPSPAPPPTPSADTDRDMINSDISSGAAVTNLGSNFLERLGNQATDGFCNAWRNNPGGGGASEATEGPRFRTWGEVYGISSTTGAQGDFVGDKRTDLGRRRRPRRAARARRQCRLFGRSKPHRHRRAAGVAVGDARSDAVRLQRLGRQGAVDLGGRAGARFRQNQFKPGHRASALPSPATAPKSTAR